MMSEDLPAKPARRPRYAGKYPRHFHEKYKELAPEAYSETVAKVLESGKTPAGSHRSIMVAEILDVLAPKPGELAVDCTLGYGGHASELLKAVLPGGRLIGIDTDALELPKTEARLRELGYPPDSLSVQRMNYAGLAQLLAREAPGGADLILADLGLSSMQIDDPSRGFTFKEEGPLDMRMNPAKGISAADLLAKLTAPRLADLLKENSDEPDANRLARAIIQAGEKTPLATTRQLADVIARTVLGGTGMKGETAKATDTIRRVFQALRIAVNDEFGALDTFLRQLPGCLKAGGRIAILTFHSGEDRRVKLAFKEGLREGLYSEISQEIRRPSLEEQRANPRSTSAKLRYAIRA